MDRPDERARLAAAARVTAQRYDITAFVRKMEQLYVLLCDSSRATRAGGAASRCARICRFWPKARAARGWERVAWSGEPQ